jgi:hypothetical protein
MDETIGNLGRDDFTGIDRIYRMKGISWPDTRFTIWI